MEQAKSSSRRVALLVVGIVVLLVIIGSLVFMAINNTKKQVVKKTAAPVAAKVTDVQQSLAVLDSTVAKASADADVANAAINKATKPTIIGDQ